jgi:hypothetical protein
MIALKNRTNEIVKKYNQSYERKYTLNLKKIAESNNDKNKSKNEDKKSNENNVQDIHGNLKKLIKKKISSIKGIQSKKKNNNQKKNLIKKNTNENIQNIEDNKNDNKNSNIEIKEIKELEEIKEKEEDANNIENNIPITLRKNENIEIVNNNNVKDEPALTENEIPKNEESELIENKSTKNDFTKETKMEFEKNIIFTGKKYSLPNFKFYPIIKRDDPSYVRQLELELEQEKKERKYYQKRCKDLEKKNKELLFRLLAKTINPQNNSADENDSFNDSKISKALKNDLNALSPRKRFRNRSMTYFKQNNNELIKIINDKKKSSSRSITKKVMKRKSKFKKIEQIGKFDTFVVSNKERNHNYIKKLNENNFNNTAIVQNKINKLNKNKKNEQRSSFNTYLDK